jgi:putative endonuclease
LGTSTNRWRHANRVGIDAAAAQRTEIPWRLEKKDGGHGIFVYTAAKVEFRGGVTMAIFSRCVFQVVRWAARRGLREDGEDVLAEKKDEARRAGVRGETYGYWYLRRHGYVFVARNYVPRGAKGEIDLIGYDGKTLAFVEVRTRTVRKELTALPELSVTTEKQRVVVRTARRFLGERHVGECPCRFDVLAIDNRPGLPPEVRLHKDAFSPQM